MKSTRLVFALLFIISIGNSAAVAWCYSTLVDNDHTIIRGFGEIAIDHQKQLDNKADRLGLQ